MNPYSEETYPENVKYVHDTPENRKLMSKLYGNPIFTVSNYSYIRFNTLEKTWRTSFDIEWLYRNPPPVVEICEIFKDHPLSFEDWYNINEDEINIELAENGADREMDFNPEKEFEKRYEKYINTSYV